MEEGREDWRHTPTHTQTEGNGSVDRVWFLCCCFTASVFCVARRQVEVGQGGIEVPRTDGNAGEREGMLGMDRCVKMGYKDR